MASKYDTIWITLKQNKQIKLAIHPALQARVIKGVIHCKDHDLIRKMELAQRRKKEKIQYTISGVQVEIKLIEYASLKNLDVAEI